MSANNLMNDESIIPIVLTVFGILAVIALIYNRFLYKKERTKHQNDLAKPSVFSKARIIAKEIASNNVYCYITFELSSGIRKRFTVQKHTVSLYFENDTGMLEYRGDTFISFKREVTHED